MDIEAKKQMPLGKKEESLLNYRLFLSTSLRNYYKVLLLQTLQKLPGNSVKYSG